MASIKSAGFLNPQMMPVDGRGINLTDKVVLAANPTAADTLDFRIPAGMEVTGIDLYADDLDSNGTPTLATSWGYAPVDPNSSLAANATYFAGTGQTVGRAAGGLRLAFKPIKFEEDVYLRGTVGTASATFAAGELHAIISGNAKGPK
jgi:hypothetical protein